MNRLEFPKGFAKLLADLLCCTLLCALLTPRLTGLGMAAGWVLAGPHADGVAGIPDLGAADPLGCGSLGR